MFYKLFGDVELVCTHTTRAGHRGRYVQRSELGHLKGAGHPSFRQTLAMRLRRLCPAMLAVRGGGRLVIALSRMFGFRGEYLITDFQGDLRFYCDLAEHIGNHIFWRGAHSADVLAYIRGHAPRSGVLIDAGANQGEITVMAAHHMSQGRVLAFEPVSANFARLRRNVKENDLTNVECINVGLSDMPGLFPIYTRGKAWDDGTVNRGLPSLYASMQRPLKVEDVSVVRLDDVPELATLSRIDLIKIDVEGAELGLLKGARDTLIRFRPTLLIELNESTANAAGYSARELCDWVAGQGYRIDRLDQVGSTGPLDCDALPDFANVVAIPLPA